MILFLSVIISLLPLVLCYLGRWFYGRDFLQPGWTYPLIALGGGTGGVILALFVAPKLNFYFGPLIETVGVDLVSTVIMVPLAEEVGKAIILLLMVALPWYRSTADGFFFGLTAGAGFSVFENILSFTVAHEIGGIDAWITAIVLRSLPSTIIHATTTGIIGAYLGNMRAKGQLLRAFIGLPVVVFLSTMIHGLWNGLMVLAKAEASITFASIALVLLMILGLAVLIILPVSHHHESKVLKKALQPVYDEGLLNTMEISTITNLHKRRDVSNTHNKARNAFIRKAMDLAYSLKKLPTMELTAERIKTLGKSLPNKRDDNEKTREISTD